VLGISGLSVSWSQATRNPILAEVPMLAIDLSVAVIFLIVGMRIRGYKAD
jgi:hypothetical protein